MTNVEILQQGYQAFAEGNMQKASANWDAGIEWVECKGFPYVKGEGIYRGINEVMEGVLAKIPEFFDGFYIEISDFVAGGDKVVMVGHYTGTWKATGKKFKANVTHTWTFKNGKATHFFQATDTAEIIGS